jgi:hypothetical protein
MKVELVPLEALAPNQNNPRVIRDDQFQKLVKSLKEFPEMLQVRPIIADLDGIVLGGNMRLRAAQEAGLELVYAVHVDWSEEKQLEFMIKDNVGFGEWDWEELANKWTDLPLTDWALPVWNLEQAKVIEGVNDLENNEWVGMPEFETAEDGVKIIIRFETIEERQLYVEQHKMEFNHKTNSAWSTWHPFRPQRDRAAFQYE